MIFISVFSFNDKSFVNSNEYLAFIDKNKGNGGLKIRAFSANEALPVVGLKVVVSTMFNDDKIIFFEGETDNSGMIEMLSLPAPVYSNDDLITPSSILYSIDVKYDLDNSEKSFLVNLYNGICVVQNITITPGVKENRYGN